MKTLFGKSTLLAATIITLMASFSAQAARSGVILQNSQFTASKSTLTVKGRISGSPVLKVYVINNETNAYIGEVGAKDDGKQFVGHLFITDEALAPCTVRVQVQKPRDNKTPTSGFDLFNVRNAPDHCDD